MIIARKVTDKKEDSLKNISKKEKKQKKIFKIKNPQKYSLIINLTTLIFMTLLSSFFIYLNNYNLVYPNFMPKNLWFYITLFLNLIFMLCFILQCYKSFNLDLNFLLCIMYLITLLLNMFIFALTNVYVVLILGLSLFTCSQSIYTTYNKLANKSTSPYLFSHIINIYLSILAIFIFLVN